MIKTRLHYVAVERIENDILSGKLSRGEKLPAEAQLAKTLGVGRRAVREALHILQNRGLVEVRQGVGAFVLRNDLDNYLASLTSNVSSYLDADKGKLENVLELREVLELYGLRRILETEKTATVEKLKENVELQKKARDDQDAALYHKAHSFYHKHIIESLDNPIILMVYEQIITLIADKIRHYAGVPEQMKRSIAEHAAIVEALERGDAAESLAAMKRHLSLAYQNLRRA